MKFDNQRLQRTQSNINQQKEKSNNAEKKTKTHSNV